MKISVSLKTIPLVALSIGAFVAVATLPIGVQGQPQNQEKKQKAKATVVKTTILATGLWHPCSLA